jgi:hypothetical protein
MELAKEFGITDYPSPAGGCLLTEPAFARKLKLFLNINPDVQLDHLEVLKAGRHFYLGENNLLIVGRNQSDNKKLSELALPQDYLLRVIDHPGPIGLLRPFSCAEDYLQEAASIVARYSDAKNKDFARVKIYHTGKEENADELLDVVPGIPEQISPI